MKAKSVSLFTLVLILTIASVFFVYPKAPIGGYLSQYLPWRLGLDLVGGSYLVYDVDMSGVAVADRNSVMNGLRDVIEKRVNLFGVSEPRVTSSISGDSYRLNVELAGIKDVNQAIKQIGETPFLQFAEVKETAATSTSATSTAAGQNQQLVFSDLNGRYVQGAQLSFSQVGLPVVNISFNDQGAKMFEDLTSRNVGKPLAIVLDNEIISAPRVNEAISGGKAEITGINDLKEAQQLVERFNAGALPAPIKLIDQQTVSASLGQDSLQKTIWAGILGTLAVMLFMVLYYHGLGFFAVIALAIYIALSLAVFKLFSVTMSLSGIAGFILSIGMAVDANVLIFERTREEMKKGLERTTAIAEGFRRAWTSIRDSNLTTILTALILYMFTSSFVQGFALTLLIGVVVSMFTAITVTENLLKIFYIRNASKSTTKGK
ncbi:MAG: protein translocase subunit SecD [Patescibacteria group bacterium]|nr:protein translocase subunit SecD [Patescibacteria group bacterium]